MFILPIITKVIAYFYKVLIFISASLTQLDCKHLNKQPNVKYSMFKNVDKGIVYHIILSSLSEDVSFEIVLFTFIAGVYLLNYCLCTLVLSHTPRHISVLQSALKKKNNR